MKKITTFQKQFDELLLDKNGTYQSRRWKSTECLKFKQLLESAEIEDFDTLEERVAALRRKLTARPTCLVCGGKTSVDLLKSSGFKTTCSQSCSANNPETREKIKQTLISRFGGHHTQNAQWSKTMIERLKANGSYQLGIETFQKRYGVINRFQLNSVKEKIKLTNLERYGVKNPQQNEEIREKTTKTCIERYGIATPASTPEVKWIAAVNRAKKNYIDTTELTFYAFDGQHQFKCVKCGLEYIGRLDFKCPRCFGSPKRKKQREVYSFVLEHFPSAIHDTRKVLDGLELDIFIPELKLGIEFNGLYWHSELNGGLAKNYHFNKTLVAENRDIQLIHIFENEWEHKQEIVKSMILAKGKIFSRRIFARKCDVREISKIAADSFLNENHLHGTAQSEKRFGLFYRDELVMVLTAGKNRFSRDGSYEIIRLAPLLNSQVIGGVSRLIRTVKKQVDVEKIITYADRRFSTGKGYYLAGGKLTGTTNPNYWYIDCNSKSGLSSRLKYQKHKLKKLLPEFDENLTEWENMKRAGFDRIWDCGSFRFEF